MLRKYAIIRIIALLIAKNIPKSKIRFGIMNCFLSFSPYSLNPESSVLPVTPSGNIRIKRKNKVFWLKMKVNIDTMCFVVYLSFLKLKIYVLKTGNFDIQSFLFPV